MTNYKEKLNFIKDFVNNHNVIITDEYGDWQYGKDTKDNWFEMIKDESDDYKWLYETKPIWIMCSKDGYMFKCDALTHKHFVSEETFEDFESKQEAKEALVESVYEVLQEEIKLSGSENIIEVFDDNKIEEFGYIIKDNKLYDYDNNLLVAHYKQEKEVNNENN